ncbi:4-phosphopantetheinyl transferase, partial [Salmonella enterica subsp. enterica]|nr:4-phosphopantetheinyl transferase [Salmonella enterica subsp. enterica]
RDLTPTLSVGYHATGNYIFNKSEVTTLIIEVPRQNSPLSASFVL